MVRHVLDSTGMLILLRPDGLVLAVFPLGGCSRCRQDGR
jgi:hypothetical protein